MLIFFRATPSPAKYSLGIQRGNWAKYTISQYFTNLLPLAPAQPQSQEPSVPPPLSHGYTQVLRAGTRCPQPITPAAPLPPSRGDGQRRGVSPAGMALSVLVILLLSVLYEAVKMGKAVLLRRALLALPRSLSRESLAESEEGGTGPTQGRYRRVPSGFAGPRRGSGTAVWPLGRRGRGEGL